MATEEKNPAAQLGSLGGKARSRNMSKEQLTEAARKAGLASWAKRRSDRPDVHEVVNQMLAAIKATGKPHTMYSVNGVVKHCETGSTYDMLWSADPDTVVGTYRDGVTFSEVLNDFLAT